MLAQPSHVLGSGCISALSSAKARKILRVVSAITALLVLGPSRARAEPPPAAIAGATPPLPSLGEVLEADPAIEAIRVEDADSYPPCSEAGWTRVVKLRRRAWGVGWCVTAPGHVPRCLTPQNNDLSGERKASHARSLQFATVTDLLCRSEPMAEPAPAELVPLLRSIESEELVYVSSDPAVPTERVIITLAGAPAKSGWQLFFRLGGRWRGLQATAFGEDFEFFSHHRPTILVPDLGDANDHSLLLTLSVYDGGSQYGAEEDWLYAVAERDGVVQVTSRVPIGYFAWSATPEERRRLPRGAAYDRRLRPHVEVTLRPEILRDGSLRLSVDRSELKRLKRFCSPEELVRRHKDDESVCGIEELDAVRHAAGHYQMEGGQLVRTP
ncbi:MAG TPA: hypothetical protein VH877_30105 [Polyangia bacterium]|jgi:hypothetical protein|nr:hypothetical protein [Polyangia bacterium]